MTVNWQESSYQNLLLAPIYSIIAVTYVLSIGLTLFRLAFWTKETSYVRKVKEADQKMIAYVLDGFFNMLLHRKNIQSLSEQQCRERLENNGGVAVQGYCLFSKEHDTAGGLSTLLQTETILRSRWAVSILSWYVATVSSLGITVFWVAFSVQERFTCDDEHDCFINGSLLQNRSLTCIDVEDYMYDVTCYELALDFPKAIAELTGILFIGANGFSFLMFVILLVVDGVPKRSRRMMAYAVIAVFEYSFVGMIICAFVARVELLGKQHPIHIAIQEFMISAALLSGVTTPWLLLMWAFSKLRGAVRRARDRVTECDL